MMERISAKEYRARTAKPRTRRKYLNKPCVVDGHHFDSKKESRRYAVLRLMEQAHEIEDLVLQPQYPIEIGGVKICVYIGDFSYFDRRLGERITEDVKSPASRTPLYRLKKKLVRAVYGIEIVEV